MMNERNAADRLAVAERDLYWAMDGLDRARRVVAAREAEVAEAQANFDAAQAAI